MEPEFTSDQGCHLLLDWRILLVQITIYPSPSIEIGKNFSLKDFYEMHSDEVTQIDALKKIHPTDGGYCCVGEGSYGSEGIIAYLDKEKILSG